MQHPELPLFAFLAAALVLVPLPWHWRTRNIGTLSIIFWLCLSNIIYGVDAIIWADTVLPYIPVWCDITTKFEVGATIGLPAACFTISVYLEHVASGRWMHVTDSDKRSRIVFECIACILAPVIYMVLHYIVQDHRFDIVEQFGCRPAIYPSLPAIFLFWVPPMLLAVGTCTFTALALRHFIGRRPTFVQHLADSHPTLTTNRFFRLIFMSCTEVVWGLVATIVNMWFAYRDGPQPWVSWANVHSNFSQFAEFRTSQIPSSALACIFFLWWTVPISAFLFVAFFVFGQEAQKEYAASGQWILVHLLRRRPAAPQVRSKCDDGNLEQFVVYPPGTTYITSMSSHMSEDTFETKKKSTLLDRHATCAAARNTPAFLVLHAAGNTERPLPTPMTLPSPITPSDADLSPRTESSSVPATPTDSIYEIDEEKFVDLPLTPAPRSSRHPHSAKSTGTLSEVARAHLDGFAARSNSPPLSIGSAVSGTFGTYHPNRSDQSTSRPSSADGSGTRVLYHRPFSPFTSQRTVGPLRQGSIRVTVSTTQVSDIV